MRAGKPKRRVTQSEALLITPPPPPPHSHIGPGGPTTDTTPPPLPFPSSPKRLDFSEKDMQDAGRVARDPPSERKLPPRAAARTPLSEEVPRNKKRGRRPRPPIVTHEVTEEAHEGVDGGIPSPRRLSFDDGGAEEYELVVETRITELKGEILMDWHLNTDTSTPQYGRLAELVQLALVPPPQGAKTNWATKKVTNNVLANIDLTRADIARLNPSPPPPNTTLPGEEEKDRWLNDELVNFYMVGLLAERDLRAWEMSTSTSTTITTSAPRNHFMSSFFYPALLGDEAFRTRNPGKLDLDKASTHVKRHKLKYSILLCERIFVPIHQAGNHWILAVVQPHLQSVQIYDSLYGGKSAKIKLQAEKHMGNLVHFVVHLADKEQQEDKRRTTNTPPRPPLFPSHITWTRIPHPKDTPTQENTVDCGVFMLACAEHLSREVPLTFQQRDIPELRTLMVAEFMMNKLFP